jgi:hypothetical protein
MAMKLVLIPIALLFSLGTAWGAPPPSAGSFYYAAMEMKPFDELDSNKDGLIDRNEAGDSKHKDFEFDAADANKDDKLNKDEYHQYVTEHIKNFGAQDPGTGGRLLQ